ncbi:MAG: hypothetical protein E6Q36_10220 [Chryseobacterium sp.]|nr:MAG: hypothetical protein E6Q36_10220 [Chryseobacterium sp.]
MNNLIINLEGNFFKNNPEMRYFDETSDLIERLGEEEASKIMHAIYLSEDPRSNFYTFSKEDRRSLVLRNYLKRDDFQWEEYEEVIKAWPTWFLTSIEKNYKALCDTFDKMVFEVSALDMTDSKQQKMALDVLKSIEGVFKGLGTVAKMFNAEQENKRGTRGQDQAGFLAQKTMKNN